MSEDVPPYITRQFICARCKKVFEPSPAEAEALLELERTFDLPPDSASAICEACAGLTTQ